jgi:hypothetical protein
MAPHIGCSYYRGNGVMPYLSRIDPSIRVRFIEKMEWHLLIDTDILYIERPVHAQYVEAVKMAKDFGVPVWADIDDNYFEIPKYNEVPFRMFMNDPCHQRTARSLQMADFVTVTTEELRQFYRKINPQTWVVPNAFNDHNYKLRYCFSDKKIVNWRGSDTHRGDLESVRKEIWKNSHKKKDWVWSFIGGGDSLWETTDGLYPGEGLGGKYLSQPFMRVTDYMRYFYEMNPSIQVNPLVDNNFNRGKSNCSWIEATYAGATVIGPDFPEWRKPGIKNYVGADGFAQALDELQDNPELRKEMYGKSFDYISENLLLSKVNEKRVEIAHKIMERS